MLAINYTRTARIAPLFTSSLLFTGIALSQTTGTWHRQSPLPTAVELYAIAQAPNGGLWAVGTDGVVTSTNDGGVTWQTTYFNLEPELRDVCFADAQHGWIAGDTSFRTTDGGTSWQPMGLPGTADLSFGDAQHGIACDDLTTLFRTADGGLSWQSTSAPGTSRLQDLVMVDANVAWAVGRSSTGNNGVILRTGNGGQSWSQQSAPGSTEIYVVTAVDTMNAWAATGPQLWRTTNGGLSWQMHTPPTPILAMAFRTTLDGVAVSQSNYVTTYLRTSDGGVTWQSVPGFGGEAGMTSIVWNDQSTATACGFFGGIARTSDAGLSWQQLANGFGDIVTDLAVVDDFRAFACTSQTRSLLRTVDAGETWQVSALPFPLIQESPESLDFVDADRGWLVATSPTQIARTDDGGDTWQQQFTADSQFYEIMAFSADVVVAAGAWDPAIHPTPAGRVIRTTDGGQTWVDITPQFFGLGNLEWYGSAKLTDQRGWLVGKVVMQTTDAGATWSQVLGPVGIGQNLDVSFADASTGWVVGEFGRIFKTGDGGLTWQQQNAGLTTSVTSVSAVNRQVAWIADADGRTMRTQDGGATWLLDSATDVGGGIFAIHMRSEDRGWVVGHPLSGLSAPGGNIYQRRPGTPLDLTFADLRAGATAELRAHGTAPNEIVLFAFSDDPLPTGGCASAAPFCVDLAAPLNILGLSLGGTDGSALLSLPIPATLVTGQVRVQCAALRAGALVTSNAVTRSLVGN